MISKNIQGLLKTYLTYLGSPKKEQGFTLAELLVASVVGLLAASGIMFITVNLLETDKKESAKTKVQQDIALALDYIAAELQESVYVYSDLSLVTDKITFPAGATPILAFWKLEAVPYLKNPTSQQDLPEACAGFPTTPANQQQECFLLKTKRNSYTLVVYAIREGNDAPWQGPARITRYQLREYDPNQLSTLARDSCYGTAPTPPNFGSWTGSQCNTLNNSDLVVLVDLVDTSQANNNAECPTNYVKTNDSDNFYACVTDPTQQAASLGNVQDVIIHLRGNALALVPTVQNREGADAYLPSLERRVQSRSAFGRNPSNF